MVSNPLSDSGYHLTSIPHTICRTTPIEMKQTGSVWAPGMSLVELLYDALRKALWFFSVIVIVVAVVLYHLEDPDSTKYDR